MNRKHNPWVALVALILTTAILVTILASCGSVTAEAKTEPRFTCEYVGGQGYLSIHIITDTETGVQYLMTEKVLNGKGCGIGLTVLQDKED